MANYSQAQLEAIRAAYVSGVTRVSYEGRTTEFRSLAEMKAIIDEIEADLAATRRRRRFLGVTSGDKGL